MDMSALDRAVQSAGSQQALAQLLGIKPPSVSGWYDRCRVPAERCIAIELATGVSRHQLRPDVFGPDPSEAQIEAVAQLRAEIDSRMSKRALRAKLGMASDKHLATLLQLPVEEVAAWPEEGVLPALPQIQRLLGAEPQAAAEPANDDPDANRIAPVDTA
ncbi:helix-turn-helix domain-containing protein [Stenotrophomonas maltophilia]|uniref:Helix-turn-helix domain-containing protein n=1 Tax=Stenotrophomonas maltophilia TaxID=40324 RepID=A0ABD7C059_STEMA|nr:YdaS family helix-turn-helix protein [Stenotrophomonas maltophilia]QQQ40937.1 helix-turn-helix domain-containing protein [Stenotrophomonas maltophilia]